MRYKFCFHHESPGMKCLEPFGLKHQVELYAYSGTVGDMYTVAVGALN